MSDIDIQSTGNTAPDSGAPQPSFNGPMDNNATPPAAPDLGSGNPPPQNGQVVPQAPTPPGQPAENLPPGSFFKNMSHSFVGAVLSGLAGRQPAKYVVDATGKTVPDPSQPADTQGDKLRRLASTALAGLAAGAAAPQQKSKFASAAAGFGAGAQAVQNNAQQKDDKSRAQAGEDYEREQQQILRKHDIARGNLLNLSTMQHINQEELDHDPERQKNLAIAKAAEDASVPVTYLSESEAMLRYKQDPKTLISEHVLLPAGMKPVTDAQGNQVYEADGTPKMEGQLVAINGMHDGTFTPPASFYEDAKKYAKYGGVSETDSLDPETPMTVENFNRLHAAILEGKKSEHQGWVKPEEVFGGPDGKTPMQRNTSTGELRAYPAGVVPNIKNEPAESAATVSEKNAAASKANAGAAKDRADTAATTGPNASLVGEDYLKTLPTGIQSTVRAVGEGRQNLPANRKEALALLEKVHQAYPDFDETKVKSWQKANNEYRGSGKTATQIVPAYNTALEHMADLYNSTTGEGIFNPLSKAYQDREVALGYVAREVGKAVSSGAMTQKESEELLNTLKGGLTPALKRERITKTAQLLHDKIDEYQTKFAESAPSSAVKVPTLISPRAAQSYDYVQSSGKSQSQSSTPQSGQNPPQQTAGHQVGDKVVQNGQTFTVTSVDANGKVTGAQ